jgi:hypothetical protein
MNEKNEIREAVLRVLVDAEPEGIHDEDVLQAVEHLEPATQAEVDAVIGELFVMELIERDDTGSPWRLVGCRS